MHLLGEQINKLKFNDNAIAITSTTGSTSMPNTSGDNGLLFNNNTLCALSFNGNIVYQQHIQKDRFEKEYGHCCRGNCGYYITNHEHITNYDDDSQWCVYCGSDLKSSSITSKFAVNEYYVDYEQFSGRLYYTNAFCKMSEINSSNILTNQIYHIDAVEDILPFDYGNGSKPIQDYLTYDEIEAGTGNMPYAHAYCTDDTVYGLRYSVTVPSNGIYALVIHYRIKDTQFRGARIIINEGTQYERSYGFTYNFLSEDAINKCINNSFLKGIYLDPYTLRVELQQGYNDITIRPISTIAKQQHFRDFYFSKIEDVCEHSINENSDTKYCTKCGKAFFKNMDAVDKIGITLAPDVTLPDTYYSTITFNNGDPRTSDGFCRVKANGTRLMSIKTINPGSYPMPVEGVTANVKCKIGSVKSVVNTGYDHETRLYDLDIMDFKTETVSLKTGREYYIVAPYGNFDITGSYTESSALGGVPTNKSINLIGINASGLCTMKIYMDNEMNFSTDGNTHTTYLKVYINGSLVRKTTLASQSATIGVPLVTIKTLNINRVSFARQNSIETCNIKFNTDYACDTTTVSYYENGTLKTVTIPEYASQTLIVDCNTEMIINHPNESSTYFSCTYSTPYYNSGPVPYSFYSATSPGDYEISFDNT